MRSSNCKMRFREGNIFSSLSFPSLSLSGWCWWCTDSYSKHEMNVVSSLNLIVSTPFIFFPQLVLLGGLRFSHSSSMTRIKREKERDFLVFWQMRFGFGTCGHTLALFFSMYIVQFNSLQRFNYHANDFLSILLLLWYWKNANSVILVFYSLIFQKKRDREREEKMLTYLVTNKETRDRLSPSITNDTI
jgi:hypothetical protein